MLDTSADKDSRVKKKMMTLLTAGLNLSCDACWHAILFVDSHWTVATTAS